MLVRVVGFSDEERHALNTLLRLSEDRPVAYALAPVGAASAGLALVDGDSFEASGELAGARTDPDERLIWIGHEAPERAARTFVRPIDWPRVVEAMDGLFAPPPADTGGVDIDFDLDFDVDLSAAQAAPAPAGPPPKRALVIDTDLERRFYWRSKLSLADWFLMDEAISGEMAKVMLAENSYQMVVVDFQQTDADPWQLVRLAQDRGAKVLVTVRDRSLALRMRARRQGVVDSLKVPLVPSQVYYAIRKV